VGELNFYKGFLFMNNRFLYVILSILFTFSTGMAYKTAAKPSTVQTLTVEKEIYREQLPNHPQVLAAFDHFYGELEKAYLEGKGLTHVDLEDILQAVAFSSEKHQDQVRKNVEKTPYIIHPLRVATHLLTIGKVATKEVIIAALLHDTIEDTDTTFDEIATLYGAHVASMVQEVTNDTSAPHHVQKEQQVLNAAGKTAGAAMVKMADKFDNLSDLINFPPEKSSPEQIDQYFRHAKAVIDNLPWVNAPLKAALETLILKHWESRAS